MHNAAASTNCIIDWHHLIITAIVLLLLTCPLVAFPHAHAHVSRSCCTEFLSLQVPHSLALLEQHDLICIADREDMRVVCRGAELSKESKEQAPLTIQQPDLGRVYAITNHGTYYNYVLARNFLTQRF